MKGSILHEYHPPSIWDTSGTAMQTSTTPCDDLLLKPSFSSCFLGLWADEDLGRGVQI